MKTNDIYKHAMNEAWKTFEKEFSIQFNYALRTTIDSPKRQLYARFIKPYSPSMCKPNYNIFHQVYGLTSEIVRVTTNKDLVVEECKRYYEI